MASLSTSNSSAMNKGSQQQYPYPSQLSAPSCFVSIKLSGETNYRPWEEQMMCLLENHEMVGFIDGTIQNPQENISGDSKMKADMGCIAIDQTKYREWKRSDILVKGWIFGSLDEVMMATVVGLHTAKDVWNKLKTTCSTPYVPARNEANVAGSQKYPYPSHVNAASFLSIKLSGTTNYGCWQEQMMCLMDCHDMLGFIDGTLNMPQDNSDNDSKNNVRDWEKSDTLVKGWIFGSLSEMVMGAVVGLKTARDVWEKLETAYGALAASVVTTDRKDLSVYQELHKAILRNEWEKAATIIYDDKDALTAKLTIDNQSALHVAVGTCKEIQFVKNLLREINPHLLPMLLTNHYHNALHYAAMVDNAEAAKMLVEKNPRLLFTMDNEEYLPLYIAIINGHKTTFLYLLHVSKQHIELSQPDGYYSPFEGIHGGLLLKQVIIKGLLDVAYELIKEHPHMARAIGTKAGPLSAVARKRSTYFSGTQYNIYQRFVYSHLPNDDLDIRDEIKDIENQETNKTSVTKCMSWFRPGIQWIYITIWKAALTHVAHIKQLKEDKVKHNKALVLLKCICEEVGNIRIESDLRSHYGKALSWALLRDIPEAIETIIDYFPNAIWDIKDSGNIFHDVITNRCEKAYTFLVHQMTHNKYLLQQKIDKDGNNILHFAGQLAPIDKLNLVSGAALQMQRELQWFEEVRKFGKPNFKKSHNKNGETPFMVFRREHKQLRREGEEWMKKTADSYTITAALIITIVFAAAITVPGGNDDSNGEAIFATKPSFIIFAVSDAISLFTSTTSLLLFLSILTTRFREEDFLYRLPKRLILGLTMLFLSVTSLMVAFSATLYLMFGHERAWILVPIATLTCLPVASFVTLQLPLLVDLISSTYGDGIFVKQRFQIE